MGQCMNSAAAGGLPDGSALAGIPPRMSLRRPDRGAEQRDREATRAFLRVAHPTGTEPTPAPAASPSPGAWILESVSEGGRQLRRMLIEPLPFRVGRQPGLELVLPSHRVSKVHAEIHEADGKLRIRDLHSRNGTT